MHWQTQTTKTSLNMNLMVWCTNIQTKMNKYKKKIVTDKNENHFWK